MRKSLAIMTFFGPLTAAGVALADEDCSVPMAQWQPRTTVETMAQAQGWTVRRIKIDDGCYELEGRDAEGREIEATVDPATLAFDPIAHELTAVEAGGLVTAPESAVTSTRPRLAPTKLVGRFQLLAARVNPDRSVM